MLNRRLLLVLIILLLGTVSFSQQTDQSISSLKGIRKMAVIVEPFNDDLHNAGLKESEIQRDAWDSLQNSGITAVPSADDQNTNGAPYLYINIGSVKSNKTDLYAVSLRIELRQAVTLLRKPDEKYYGAATWSLSNIGILSKDNLKQIRNFIDKMICRFISDYRTATGSASNKK